ncbi:hypothetical protein [Pseudoxanthomonas putridarboris]|uniref:Uncharacterized protein n=1 Tax=Pseudoxanthomonas putridarboris TaxID=752605 RepID=A0ABU9J2P2_9GAMM
MNQIQMIAVVLAILAIVSAICELAIARREKRKSSLINAGIIFVVFGSLFSIGGLMSRRGASAESPEPAARQSAEETLELSSAFDPKAIVMEDPADITSKPLGEYTLVTRTVTVDDQGMLMAKRAVASAERSAPAEAYCNSQFNAPSGVPSAPNVKLALVNSGQSEGTIGCHLQMRVESTFVDAVAISKQVGQNIYMAMLLPAKPEI